MTGPDPDIARLAGHFPGWRIWRRAEDRMLVGWLVGSQPPVVVYGATADQLRQAIEDVQR